MTKDWEEFESPHEHKVPAEALKQPTTQEPLTHVIGIDTEGYSVVVKLQSPLYTHPKQWQGLSDDEIKDKAIFFNVSDISLEDFIGVIDRTLKERNT